MTRKTQRTAAYSDEDNDEYFDYSPEPTQEQTQQDSKDYLDHMCDIHVQLKDYCYDQALHFLDHDEFNGFCEFLRYHIP